jgi:hypothetical protein
MKRVELYWWVTRQTKQLLIGITNRDKIDNVYYAIAEIDYKYPIDALVRRFEKCGLGVAMIYETVKGYHIYTCYCSANAIKVLHVLYKTKIADRGHLSLGKQLHQDYRLILRVSRKYPQRDLRPILMKDENMTEWHHEVKELIEVFQGD